ncbi:MAG TPA: VOC family protein [Mycobacteriales bacterium]|jgi:hypothetical protein|nr:VOC family protein [Mycobacteriales bacterium]
MAVVPQITIDCIEPARLVPFWCTALGYIVEPPPGGHDSWNEYWRSIGIPEHELPPDDDDVHDSIVDPDGVGPRIWFQAVPEPKVVKNRLHLDLKIADRTQPKVDRQPKVDGKAAELVAAGATLLRQLQFEDSEYYGVVMQDPEGNEFCVS